MLTKFQKELKTAIQECYCMKPISNNEDSYKWIEHYEKAQERLNAIITKCYPAVDLVLLTQPIEDE